MAQFRLSPLLILGVLLGVSTLLGGSDGSNSGPLFGSRALPPNVNIACDPDLSGSDCADACKIYGGSSATPCCEQTSLANTAPYCTCCSGSCPTSTCSATDTTSSNCYQIFIGGYPCASNK